MSGHGEKLSRKQGQAISALLSESTISAAAAKVKVSEATLRRWLQDSAFLTAFRRARRRVVEHTISQIQSASAAAVATLRKNLKAKKATDANKAAQILLGLSLRGLEVADLEERLAALEARLQPRRGKDQLGMSNIHHNVMMVIEAEKELEEWKGQRREQLEQRKPERPLANGK